MLDGTEARGNPLQQRQSAAVVQASALFGHESPVGTEDAADCVRRDAEQFNHFCRTFSVPNGARMDWLATTHFPLKYFILQYLSMVTIFSLRAFTFIVGARELSDGLRIRTQSVAYASCTATFTMAVLTWFIGPSFIDNPRTRSLGLVTFAVALFCLFTLNFPPLLSPEHGVPHQSRFAFLLLSAPMMLCDHLVGSLVFVTNERLPPDAPMWTILTRAGVKTLRGMDAFSDIIYMRVLWEKVRPSSVASPCLMTFQQLGLHLPGVSQG